MTKASETIMRQMLHHSLLIYYDYDFESKCKTPWAPLGSCMIRHQCFTKNNPACYYTMCATHAHRPNHQLCAHPYYITFQHVQCQVTATMQQPAWLGDKRCPEKQHKPYLSCGCDRWKQQLSNFKGVAVFNIYKSTI